MSVATTSRCSMLPFSRWWLLVGVTASVGMVLVNSYVTQTPTPAVVAVAATAQEVCYEFEHVDYAWRALVELDGGVTPEAAAFRRELLKLAKLLGYPACRSLDEKTLQSFDPAAIAAAVYDLRRRINEHLHRKPKGDPIYVSGR